MLALHPAPPAPRAPAVLAAASAALLALALLWALAEPRLIGGAPAWLKPAKFAASFLMTFVTLAWAQSRLSPGWADGWTLRLTSLVMGAAFLFEMAYLFLQAARGEASHFNVSTPTAALMYALMGVGAVLLVLGIAVFGFVTLLDRAAAMRPGLRVAAGAGMVASGLLTLLVAGWLSANGSPFVGTPPEGARAWPLLGWSGSVGDYRPAHFLALHGMQALPLLAVLLGRRATPALMVGAAGAWGLLTLGAFAQAMAGLPLIRL